MVANREEMISKLDGLLEAAKSGSLSPEDITEFEDVVACARDYVPEFDAGSAEPMPEDDFDIEDEEPMDMEASVAALPALPKSGGMFGAEPEKKKSRMLPEYKSRDGR